MAALAATPPSASAGRRGVSPPPRQERPVASISSTTENGTPSLASQQAARMSSLLKSQQRTTAPSPTGLPGRSTPSSSSLPTTRPNRRINTQPNALGNLLARQQFDERPANDAGDGDGYSEPDSSSMEEPDFPEQQSSVLDMANQAFAPNQQAPATDNDQSPAREQSPNEQIAARDSLFKAAQRRGQAQQAHFTQQENRSNEPATAQSAPPAQTNNSSASPTNRLTSFLKQKAIDKALEASKDPQSALSEQNIQETVSEVKGLVDSARRLGTFAGGIFSLTFLPSLQPLAEQNIVVINRLVFKGSIRLPGLGGRAPDALERNPSLKWVDRADLFFALCMNVITGAIIMIVIGICAAIAYIFYLLTTNSLELYQQLMN